MTASLLSSCLFQFVVLYLYFFRCWCVCVFDDDASAVGDTHTRTQKYSVTHSCAQNDPAQAHEPCSRPRNAIFDEANRQSKLPGGCLVRIHCGDTFVNDERIVHLQTQVSERNPSFLTMKEHQASNTRLMVIKKTVETTKSMIDS